MTKKKRIPPAAAILLARDLSSGMLLSFETGFGSNARALVFSNTENGEIRRGKVG